ncbi:MAG TPA: undecaprenyl-diphosphate phosphatase [Solirubrobacteraceae bacterium]|nr:undecaprenyl-diphosphate phosphatase [Solirubrobacteraceae bacterium]
MSSPTDPTASRDDLQATRGTGQEIALREALVLGALHGPAELLPISSSGHVAVIPWLLGWDYRDVDAELRKAFEVALHAGTAAALLITLRTEVSDAVRGMSPRVAELIALSFVPPAIVGYTLERPIERHLGTPATIVLGLVAGSVAMARADRAPQARTSRDARAADALWLGLAQACALLPGVSRNGATLAAARRRRFTREDANKLSRHVALPVIAGATLLKGVRLARRGLPPRSALPIAVGAGASFASTLGSTWLIRQVERDRSLLPYALYRIGLAAVILGRLAARHHPPATAPVPSPQPRAESDPYTTMAT